MHRTSRWRPGFILSITGAASVICSVISMDDRSHFAALILASQLGVLSKAQVMSSADRRILDVEKPAHWLIDVSTDGYSVELGSLMVGADDSIYREVLQLAFDAWVDCSISEQRFLGCCETLCKTAGDRSRWYDHLTWIEAEFDLVAQGVLEREASVRKVREHLEILLER
jgi:hypothetical protein